MAEQATPPLYDTLNNKTFHGLLIAEFLAAFNDQCIHAAAMFFAITKGTLRESQAVILMPLLFYMPWALFAPLAGYFADRYSKRTSLIFWKVAEIGITGVALLGFWLGTTQEGFLGNLGPWLVMSAVFLMGTHSTFYVPNKYGVLPEIFTVRMLSRANGLIESTTFLAVIFGTTTGGILMFVFKEEEYYLGVILVILAIIGTVTSYFIRHMPPADPDRPFPGWLPWHMFRPIIQSVVNLGRSRLAGVALLGLAAYVFILVYMRASLYMFGESRNPPWTEQDISLIVAVVSLGIGIGSPLAGYISGGKVELGLVVIGGLGMILSLTLASFSIFSLQVLVIAIALIGLFSSFYLVPLYSLLQYSAPKGSKGQAVATNNFICNIGAVLATVVLFLIIQGTQAVGLAEPFKLEQVGIGVMTHLEGTRHHPEAVEIQFTNPDQPSLKWHEPKEQGSSLDKTLRALLPAILSPERKVVIRVDDRVPRPDESEEWEDWEDPEMAKQVAVSKYNLRGTEYYHVRPAWKVNAVGKLEPVPPPLIYNNEQVPRFLFLGAAALMLIVLVLLCLRLPSFPLRSLVFLKFLGKPFLGVSGYQNLPAKTSIMVTNCATLEDILPVISGTVRPMLLILPNSNAMKGSPILRLLASYAGTRFLKTETPTPDLFQLAQKLRAAQQKGFWIVLSTALPDEQFELLLRELEKETDFPVVPVFSHIAALHEMHRKETHITIGEPLPPGSTAGAVREVLDSLYSGTLKTDPT